MKSSASHPHPSLTAVDGVFPALGDKIAETSFAASAYSSCDRLDFDQHLNYQGRKRRD
jgi:hypothetical protein